MFLSKKKMATGGVVNPVVPLILAFSALIVKLDGFGGHARVMPSVFTCGPRGIKHHNKTQGFLPDVKISCTHLMVKVDRSVDITCEVISRTFAKITWYVNGNQQRKSHIAVNDKTCGQTLEITAAEVSDSGNYTCKAANVNGTVSKTCALSVREDKTNQIHIEDLKLSGPRQTALLGGSVKLKCNLLNAEVATWLINGRPAIKSRRHVWRTIHTFGQRGMIFTLKISNVTALDEGWYMCIGYKSGVRANKTFYLKTEACPEGYHCPNNTNLPFRCPSAKAQGLKRASHGRESSSAFRNGGHLSPHSPWILVALLTVLSNLI